MPSERGSAGASATLVRPPGAGRDQRPGRSPPTDRADTHCRDRLARNFEPSGPPPSLPCRPNVDPAHQPRLCARPAPDGTDAPDRTYPRHPPPTAPTPTAETGWLVISSRVGHHHPCRAVRTWIRRCISHACAPARRRTGPTPRTEPTPPSPPTDRADTHCRDRLARNFEPSGPPPSLPCRPNVDPPAHQPRLCARPAPDGTDAPDGHPPPTAPTPTAETGWLVISSRVGHHHPCRAVRTWIRRTSHACAPARRRTGPTPRTELTPVTPHRPRRHPLPRPVGS